MASRAGLLVGAVGLTLAFAACSLLNEYQPVPDARGGGLGVGGSGGSEACASDADCDDENDCTADSCAAGVCTNSPLAAGTSCNAGAGSGSCDDAGMCVVACTIPNDPACDDGNACTVDVCNLITGVCDRELLDNVEPPGMSNQDGDCVAFTCVAGVVQIIDVLTDVPVDGNDCTEDVCVPGTGGENATPQNVNSPADSPCGVGGNLLCDGMGNCQNCNSNDDCGLDSQCLVYTCSNSTCVQTPQTGSACDDGVYCNGSDTCGSTGQCSNHAGDPCPGADLDGDCSETCNESADNCNGNDPNGSGCNDSNVCTLTDVCQGGVCTGTNPKTCTAQDQCHNVGTCNAATGMCSNPTKPNGSICNDGLYCTQIDTCQSGTCVGSGNPCPGADGDNDCSETCDESANACTANDPNFTVCAGNPSYCCYNGQCTNTVQCPQ